jgi:hypothetical protein
VLSATILPLPAGAIAKPDLHADRGRSRDMATDLQSMHGSRAVDLLTKYLKLKATGKAAKGAVKVAKWTTAAKVAKAAAQRVPKKGPPATAGGRA